MTINGYRTKYLSSQTYLLEENGHGILIDPCEVPELSARIAEQKLQMDMVLLTHEHSDHIMGVEWVQNTFGPIVQCSAICGERIQDPKKNYSYYFELFKSLMEHMEQDEDVTVTPFSCHADSVFESEKKFFWQGHAFLLKSTPGHAAGSICILVDGQFLFTGDTLMNEDKTVTAFLDGSMEQMKCVTLPWLRSLDRNVRVYPGHFNSFLLGERLDRGIF